MSSDVYALGILLSILLCGHHPYRVYGLHRSELTRVVLQQDPEPPSRAVTRIGDASPGDGEEIAATGVATARGTTIDQLRGDLEGSLDAIVVQALRRDPAQRYGSVALLAEDVQRHIEGASRPRARSLLRRLFG